MHLVIGSSNFWLTCLNFRLLKSPTASQNAKAASALQHNEVLGHHRHITTATCRSVHLWAASTIANKNAVLEDTMCKPTKLPCLHCLHKRCFMQDLCLSDRTTIKLRCEDISNVFMKGGANTTHAVQQCNYKLD